METVTQITEVIDTPIETIPLYRGYVLHLINTPSPNIPFSVLGSYGHICKTKPSYIQQYFILSNNGKLISNSKKNEISILLKICGKVEDVYKEDELKVIDIRLPKSHGYSGTKYNYLVTREKYKDSN